jgi:type I restriction enzyme M protein
MRGGRSLEASANLPAPEVLAAEIVADLEAALEQFRGIAEALGEEDRGEGEGDRGILHELR